ncbi:unnamed protein product [Brassicogethes aeneus]|uniref:C2H2-type domain-containing protein n=1 Tax=Brassicogethes aeneus TaxID=1431903 RepID=A0A9P0AUG7_BRAAE|nr:unnamed protein product [Brassicogethes aeneus]
MFYCKKIPKFESLPDHLALPLLLMRKQITNPMLTITKIDDDKSPDKCDRKIFCPDCGRAYKLKSSLRNHQKWECGKEPQFRCTYCGYKAKQKMHITRHILRMHKVIDYSLVKNEMVDVDN